MDKRTVFLFLSLTLVLLGVNTFFEYQHQENVRLWEAQQQTKLTKQRLQLEEDLTRRTERQLPVVALYRDAALQDKVGFAVRGGEALLALPQSSEGLPSEVYIATQGKNTQALRRSFSVDERFAIYAKEESDVLKVGSLSLLGSYDLQLIFNDRENSIELGEYRDGHFVLPLEELRHLYEKTAPTQQKPLLPMGEAVVLLRAENSYLPVGLYSTDGGFLEINKLEGKTPIAIERHTTAVSSVKKTESYYVLENKFQQLVFSTKGGALVEINLPLKDASHLHSLVKPIEFDREIVEFQQENAFFPLYPHFVSSSSQGVHGVPIEKEMGLLGGYYPLLRRDLKLGGAVRKIPAIYYATNIVSEYPEMAELHYRVKEFTPEKIVFEATQPNRRITKTYSLGDEEAPYCFTLKTHIEGDARGLWLTSGIPDVELISNAAAPALKYRATRQGSAEVKLIDLPTESATYSQIQPDWLCNSNGFFGLLFDSLTVAEGGFRVQHVSGEIVPSRLLALEGLHPNFTAALFPGYIQAMPLKGGSSTFRFFAGPFATDLLKAVDTHYSDPTTGYTPDYLASQSSHGWFEVISGPLVKGLFVLMSFFHFLTGSWGIAIILLTVTLRLVLYPLNAWSMRSTLKMQMIGPEVAAIQEKYKKDPKKAQAEVVNLYRERGVNPLSGCVPMLIQIPFLMGMFDLLKSTFELRGATFIPGWIDNLAAPDVVWNWGVALPLLGNQLHLLPIISGAIMFLQQRMMGPQDPHLMTEKDRQQRAMGSILGVVFTVMFYQFPSGINLYWISTSLLGILQQWWSRPAVVPATSMSIKTR